MLVDYTADKYHEDRHPELIVSHDLRSAWSDYAQRTYFAGIQPQSTILEFGGALGYNLASLSSSHDCSMLELSEIGRRFASEYGIKTYANVADLQGQTFDFVLCRHVLEHVDTPSDVLRQLKELTSAQGRLIIVLPCEPSGDIPRQTELDFHLHSWNPRIFHNLATHVGLKVATWRFNHLNGRRRCIAIYRRFGVDAYAYALNALGRMTNSREMIFELDK